MSKRFQVEALKTSIFRTGDDLVTFIAQSTAKRFPQGLPEKSILAVTSKIVSLAEKRLISRDAAPDKQALVRREADQFLGEIAHGVFLTVKAGLFIPSAGIDESNSESGDYILFPKDPFASARDLWQGLKKLWGIRDFGILITDSHTQPLRNGVTGICLSYWGFKGTEKLIGKPDLFGRKLKMTHVNIVDSLAASAVVLMGEADDACPLALIEGFGAEFQPETDPTEVSIPLESDLYYPVFKNLIQKP